MKNKLTLLLSAVILMAFGCKNKPAEDASLTMNPEAGTTYNAGKTVTIKVNFSPGYSPDSVVYYIDSAKLAVKKDSLAFSLKTDTLALGVRVITAKVYHGGASQDVNSNILLLAAKAPENYTYKVEKVYPHDTSCYTEGLIYQDGHFCESCGGYLIPPPDQEADGQSSLRKVDLATGKPISKVMIDPHVFGEGISIIGDKLIQLTYHEKIGYVYDKNSLKQLSTFTNNVGVEGWGMCYDGKKLYMDDSTNRIWFLDKTNCRQIGYIDVCDDKQQINEVNELEYIDGKLYANVYQTDNILVIDPKTGAVLEKIDLSTLYPKPRKPPADVLNGIAYDAATKRIFITGKKWQHLYQITFSKK